MLIETDAALAELITAIVSRAGWSVLRMAHSETALATLSTDEGLQVTAIMLDRDVAREATCQLIAELKRRRPEVPVLLLASASSHSIAVEAIRAGASDCLAKPVAPDRLLQSLRLVTSSGVPPGLQPLAERLDASASFDSMVGISPAFLAALAKAAMAARGQGHVLVEGESGTGKDMLMRAIHAASLRAKLPVRFLNLRGVAPEALERTLFGEMENGRNAFVRKVGAFEECDGGTLVLDEINRLPSELQRSLADAITDRRIHPLGAKYSFRVDVRVIAATNQPLAELAENGGFDRHLFEAFAATTIQLPPLRQRIGDIPALSRLFVGQIRNQFGLNDLGITDGALSLLSSYTWPTNIRQLQAVLLRAAALCRGRVLTSDDFSVLAEMIVEAEVDQASLRLAGQAGVALYTADGNLRSLKDIETDVVRLAIGHYQGRMSEVARRLRIGRSTLYRKLDELGIVAVH